jgi:predicted nucleic acid-binding protein
MKKFKLYLETSVWCHYYADDAPEKILITKALFELIEKGMYEIYTSELVVTEIKKAQEIDKIKLQNLIGEYIPIQLEVIPEVYKLADKYIKFKALPHNSHTDAMHASITSVYKIDILVSWNYKHLTSQKRRNKISIITSYKNYRKS